MAEQSPPFEAFIGLVQRACGPADRPNRANRATLRRALLPNKQFATFETLSIIGAGVNEHDTSRLVALKVGVAALYATHGRPGSSQPWTTPATILGEATSRSETKSKTISADRAGRELLGVLRETDAAAQIRRCHRAMTLCGEAAARVDWGRLIADLAALASGDAGRRRKVEDRWARDYARILESAPIPSTAETVG